MALTKFDRPIIGDEFTDFTDLGGGMRGRVLILVTLCLAALIINLDTTIVNVALPALVRQTGATTTDLQWVVDSYNLVFGALILAAGSLADRLGRKGMLLAGLGVFGSSSLAGAFATTTGQLIAARAVMGLGAAMMFPSTLSLLTNVFTERRQRALAIGVWGASAGVASRWARSPAGGCWNSSGGAPSSSSWHRWPRCSRRWSPGRCPPPGICRGVRASVPSGAPWKARRAALLLRAPGHVLESPGIAVWVGERGVQDPARVFDRAHCRTACGECCAGLFDVADH